MSKSLATFLFLFCTLLASAQATQWTIQSSKASVEFKIRNFGIYVDGSFMGIKGDIKFSPTKLAESSFDVNLNVRSIETGNNKRDEHLRSSDYFNAAKYPTIRIQSISIKKENIKYRLSAKLTIKDVTKTISFPFFFTPAGNLGVFVGSFEIDRRDFNVGGNSLAMGDNVKITIAVPVSK